MHNTIVWGLTIFFSQSLVYLDWRECLYLQYVIKGFDTHVVYEETESIYGCTQPPSHDS